MTSRRNRERRLNDDDIAEYLDEDGDSSFDESIGSDDVYIPPQGCHRGSRSEELLASSSEEEYNEEWLEEIDVLQAEDTAVRESVNVDHVSAENREDIIRAAVEVNADIDNESSEIQNDNSERPVNANFTWGPVLENFTSRKTVSIPRVCRTSECFTENSKPIDIFLKFFPKSLLDYIAQCTNLRIEKARNEVGDRDSRARKRSYMTTTDRREIAIVLGCTLIMGYNQLPSFSDYWSTKPSLGNTVVKAAISRDRCKFLLGKLYFANPEKPTDASKTYYVEDVLNCLKKTFKKYREDSYIQSIDESMTKFKGRSSLKQYMPMKPVKRGIKMWVRADARSGNGRGTIAVRWQDTKDVLLMSNCHGTDRTEVSRKLKTGSVITVPAPEIVAFYRRAMFGVDRNDRMVGEHEFERKSKKWWRKVFYRLLKMAIVNSWVIYREKVNKKCAMKDFLVELAPEMLEFGKSNTNKWKRRQTTATSSVERGVIGNHLPLQMNCRKRCVSCTQKKKDTRTYTSCMTCNKYLCKNCFTPWHLA
ncbi:unnamed protein product [Parnassius mnemosyne]|uniref:PiggyBac transposable element-derived protein domain-containing protein n=1 Tax=Parnassius mnemosyne TaxID=213953 RepID=A0AAV1LFI8_9NEOP